MTDNLINESNSNDESIVEAESFENKKLRGLLEITRKNLRTSKIINLTLLGVVFYQLSGCPDEKNYSPAEQEQMDQNYRDFMRLQKGR